MRVALLADIHANREALAACLAHARRAGVDRLAFLGDLVGYGADPAAVVDAIAVEADKGALVVKGNHDDAIAAPGEFFNEAAEAAVRWTRKQLDARQAAFLAALPLVRREPEGLFIHASAVAPARWEYVDSPAAAQASLAAAELPRVFCGHVHSACLYTQRPDGRAVAFRPTPAIPVPVPSSRGWLAIPGSVGQPRDGHPAAAYAIADLDRDLIVFHRVPYDSALAARKVREAGLPASIAWRIERGI